MPLSRAAWTLSWILILVSGFAGLAQAQVRCESVFVAVPTLTAADPAALRLIDELAQFQIEIDTLHKDTDRALALDEFREKFLALARTLGPDFKERYLARLEEARTGAGKVQAEKEALADQVQHDRQAALEWTRLESLGLQDHGVFVGADRYLAQKGGQYIMLDRHTKQTIPWPSAVGAIASHSKLEKAAVTADGRYLIIAELMGFIRRVDLQTGEEVKEQGPHDTPSRMELSEDGSIVAVTDTAGEAAILRVDSMKRVYRASLGPQTGWRDGIVISPDARYVFFRRSQGDPILVDVPMRRDVNMFKRMRAPRLQDGYFSADSKNFTAVGAKGNVFDYEFATGDLKPAAYTFGAVSADQVYVAPDRSRVMMVNFTHAEKEAFKVIDTASGADLTPTELKDKKMIAMHSSTQSGSRFYVTVQSRAGGAETYFMIYDFADGSVRTFDHTSLGGYLRPRATPDGNSVYVLKGTELYEIH